MRKQLLNLTRSLPRQSKYQRLKLFGIEFDLRPTIDTWPMKLTLVQAPRRQPDTDAVVHQDFHPVRPAVGKEVSAVPARMSIGSVASQMASTRTLGQATNKTRAAVRIRGWPLYGDGFITQRQRDNHHLFCCSPWYRFDRNESRQGCRRLILVSR